MEKIVLISYLITVIAVLKNLLLMAILLRSIAASFVSPYSQKGAFVQLLFDASDPFINLAKKLPHTISMIDLSPMIAMIMVDLGGRLLIILLTNLA